jgi:hypothetical protein
MAVQVGLELNMDGRALAWALDYPGCFAYGKEGPEALMALARSLVAYEDWVNRRGGSGWLDLGDFDVRLVETWTTYGINRQYELDEEGYSVNAWFRHDWKPLSPVEAQRGLSLLSWTRADLLRAVEGLDDEQLDNKRTNERWSVRGVLKHAATAEWWYLDRLGLWESARADLPADIPTRLEKVRARLNAVLPELAEKEWVVGKDGEFWSPRKLLRRALWHELDHVQHILKLRY